MCLLRLQEPQGILKVPSLPNFSLACLLDQAPDKESMGLPAAADMLLLPSLGLPARLCPQVSSYTFLLHPSQDCLITNP